MSERDAIPSVRELPIESVDTSEGFTGYFGCTEFETGMLEIVNWLKNPNSQCQFPDWIIGNHEQRGQGWAKKFSMLDVLKNESAFFAMLCAAGWISNAWFPKGAFTVSKAAIQRISERQIEKHKPKMICGVCGEPWPCDLSKHSTNIRRGEASIPKAPRFAVCVNFVTGETRCSMCGGPWPCEKLFPCNYP